jgi:parallel beta-helix repeat protein
MKLTKMVQLCALAWMLIFAESAFCTTFYVSSSTGLNSRSCAQAQSSTTPKLTLNNVIVNCMAPSDTLIVMDGTYAEALIDIIPSGSSSSNHTIIQAQNRNMAIVAPTVSPTEYVIRLNNLSNITIDGLDVTAGSISGASPSAVYGCSLSTQPCSNITIKNGKARDGKGTYGSGVDGYINNSLVENMDITNNGSGGGILAHGVYMSGSNSIIRGNRVSSTNAGFGIHIFRTGGGSNNNLVIGNTITTSSKAGIILATGSNNQAINNITYGNTDDGIVIFGSATSTLIYNNTIYNNGRWCIHNDTSSGANSGTIRNNICRLNSMGAISDPTGLTCSNNFNVTGCGTAQGATDPLFVNAGAFNFQLTASSTAIAAGFDLSGIVTDDFLGLTRTVPYDDGAYRFVTGGSGGIIPIYVYLQRKQR